MILSTSNLETNLYSAVSEQILNMLWLFITVVVAS